MDFGIGFLSTNLMLPILDFFYRIVPSYGFAIIALTLVIRFALYPLSAGSIRNMRRMRIAQPMMKKRQEEIQSRYKDNPEKQREEMAKLMQEFGNPLAGCLPLLLQMPILFALFATLRGSPFADVDYTVDVQIFPREQIERIQPQPFVTKSKNVYIEKGVRYPVVALLPGGNKIGVGETIKPELQTVNGNPLQAVAQEASVAPVQPQWEILKGEERLQLNPDGTVTALAPGEATLKGSIPGIAKNEGFLFIQALGEVGAVGEDGTVHWDVLGMVLFFGISLYVNQLLSGQQNTNQDTQQQAVSRLTPILFTGMFLFFPLPAGVLMYITIANAFQTLQTFILMREPLPENLQKLVDQQEQEGKGREALPFEKQSKKKEKASG